jgi:hypothetical protein
VSRLLFDTTFLIDAERAGGDLDDLIADDDEVAVAAVTQGLGKVVRATS